MEYIRRSDKALEALGYTEHSFHVEKVAQTASMILTDLDILNDRLSLLKLLELYA